MFSRRRLIVKKLCLAVCHEYLNESRIEGAHNSHDVALSVAGTESKENGVGRVGILQYLHTESRC